MAATQNFADALQALVAHRDELFLTRIAQDYNLNLEELKGKYHETCGGAFKVPKKREAKVKVVKEGEEPTKKCCATTAKKEQCKFSCLHGEVFCKRHLNASQKEPKPEKEKKEKKIKKVKEVPVHNHSLDGVVHADCLLCQTHGNQTLVYEPAKVEPQPEPVVIPAEEEEEDTTAAEIEAALAESEPESEEEEEDAPAPYEPPADSDAEEGYSSSDLDEE